MDTWSEESLGKYKVIELKEEVKKINKPIYGTKTVLIHRLLSFKGEQCNQKLLTKNLQLISFVSSTPCCSQNTQLERIDPNISSIQEETILKETDTGKDKRPSNKIFE